MSLSPEELPQDPDISAVRNAFVENLWRGMLVIAVLAIPLSIARIVYSASLPLYMMHLGLAVFAIVMSTLRHRMTSGWRAGVLFGLLWSSGFRASSISGSPLPAPGGWC